MKDNVHRHNGSCYCGAVSVSVEGEPALTAYCHCHSCRTWHSAPIAALAGWPESSVSVSGEVIQSKHNDESERTACAKCGGNVLTGKPGLGLKVVYPMILADSDFQFTPAFHIFYDERVIDVNDGLPKFTDVPKEAGGSGNLDEEPASSQWRA